MVQSRIPLIGLPHRVNVVRYSYEADTAGGIQRESSPSTVYLNRKGRITTTEDDREMPLGAGFDSPRYRKVILVNSHKIEENDFLQVSWGTIPNVSSPLGLAEDAPFIIKIGFDGVPIQADWDTANDKYASSGGEYEVLWTGSVWRLDDISNVFTYDFTGYTKTQNIFKLDWSIEVTGSPVTYTVEDRTGLVRNYRIVWIKHQIDDVGAYHHTSLVIELLTDDT